MLFIKLNRNLSLFFVFFSCIVLVLSLGCGGSQGSSGNTGASPDEIEVRSEVSVLNASISAENIIDAMTSFDSNLEYYHSEAPVAGSYEDYNKFRDRLTDFFAKAEVNDFNIDGLGIEVSFESVAMVRGFLSCSYKNTSSETKQLSEQIEMRLEKEGPRWRIVEFYAYDDSIGPTGAKFPPNL
jgi:hypothetical protein